MQGMRWIAAILLLISATSAQADSRLKLKADRAVVIVVNLVPHPMTGGGSEEISIDLRDGQEGLQNVRVLNALGQEQWKGQILVKKDQLVKARWKGRIFEVYDRKAMAPDRQSSNRRMPHRPVAGHKGLDALAASTTPGNSEDDVLAAIAEANAAAAAEEDPAAPAASEEPKAPAGNGVSKLELVNRTSSWANAWVDGELAHEFRGKGNSVVLELSAGEHKVQFRDFQDKEDWGQGTITVSSDITVQLHFSKAEKPEAINRTDAWVSSN